jgi:opacity protein-like surface antigen
MKHTLMLMLLLGCLIMPGALLAQEAEEAQGAEEGATQEDSMAEPTESPYMNPDEGWKDHRFHVGAFVGGLSGGTSVGLAENLLFRTQFDVDSGTLYGARVGWVFAPRFDLEVEFGTSSPGLDATITDLSGQGKTVVPFAALDISYLMGVVNYSVIDRNKRIVPFLSLGVGMVRSDSSDNDSIGNTETGIVYGGGVKVRIIDILAIRGEVRGMRSGLGTNQENPGDLPAVFVNDFNASFLIWSVGAELRF